VELGRLVFSLRLSGRFLHKAPGQQSLCYIRAVGKKQFHHQRVARQFIALEIVRERARFDFRFSKIPLAQLQSFVMLKYHEEKLVKNAALCVTIYTRIVLVCKVLPYLDTCHTILPNHGLRQSTDDLWRPVTITGFLPKRMTVDFY